MKSTDSEQNLDEIATAMEPYLQEGDSYVVYRHNHRVAVKKPVSWEQLRERHPRLFGYMLALNTRIDDSVSGLSFILYIVICSVATIVLPSDWSLRFFAWNFPLWQNVLVYPLIWIVGLFLFSAQCEYSGQRVYRAVRQELFHEINQAAIGRAELIAYAHGETKLEALFRIIKNDPDFLK